jgi:hypothetical protein
MEQFYQAEPEFAKNCLNELNKLFDICYGSWRIQQRTRATVSRQRKSVPASGDQARVIRLVKPCCLHFGLAPGRLHVTPELPMASRSKSRSAPKHLSSREKVQAHRKRLRARGLRPIQVWVPDTRTAAFKGEAHRQSQLVAQSRYAQRDQDFIDAISLQPGD